MDHCPIEDVLYYREDDTAGVMKIHPLSLLLAMGNDRGGGDFHSGGHGYEYVGTWVDSIDSVEVYENSDDIDGFDELSEFRPDFSEKSKLIAWDKEEELVAAKLEEARNK